MKNRFIGAISAILISATIAFSLVACGTTGGLPSVSEWYARPDTQAQLANLQDFAFTHLTQLLGGLFGGGRSSVSEEAAIQDVIAQAKAKYPTIPSDVITEQVRGEAARVKAKKHGYNLKASIRQRQIARAMAPLHGGG